MPKSNESGAILIPMEGVYFLGADIKIKTKDKVNVEIKFVDNSLSEIVYCQNVYRISVDYTQTITLSCFARFISKTNLALRIRTLQAVETEVVKGSTLCVQNMGMIGQLTSFILPLKNAAVVNKDVTIPIQMNIREYKYFNSFSGENILPFSLFKISLFIVWKLFLQIIPTCYSTPINKGFIPLKICQYKNDYQGQFMYFVLFTEPFYCDFLGFCLLTFELCGLESESWPWYH